MHYQIQCPQAQLLTVLRGEIFDVVVDLRWGSPTFGRWFGMEVKSRSKMQIYMAPGLAHGFCVLSESADLYYKVTEEYDPVDEGRVLWNDPEIGINWPLENPIVSPKDSSAPPLNKIIAMQALPNV